MAGLSRRVSIAKIAARGIKHFSRVAVYRNPGRVSYSYVSSQNLVSQAYRVKNFQISGPDWLDSVRFDIETKLAA